MSVLSLSNDTVGSALISASKKYNVPIGTLIGVFGQETDFGQNVATSSAGAVGPFQFTAANKGTGVLYPMTNTPNAAQFGQQADAAAAYLASLFKQTGSWDKALQSYSGGGYGLSQIQSQLTKAPSSLLTSIAGGVEGGGGSGSVPGTGPGPSTPIGAATNAVSGIPGAITDVFNTAVNDAKYAAVTVAILVVGVYLVTRAFGGGSGEKTKVIPVPA